MDILVECDIRYINSSPSKHPLEDDDLVKEEAIKVSKTRPLGNNLKDKSLENNEIINIKESKSHPLENVIEPKNINEALKDESWVIAMQEELNQFVSNDVWELVPNPMDMTIIGTKRVFRNKLDENGVVSRNKARLVAQGYNQQEGIEYDETYAPVARLESIRILLAYACALDFRLFQIDVKSAFLNGFINEEARYHVCLCARFQEDPKTSHLEAVKRIFRYVKGTTHLGLWYPKGSDIETIVYADSDHAGDYVDRKSTSGICTFMGCCLTSWFSKKQTALAISTTEAEYVSAGKACQQALWMKQALVDYGIRLDDIPIMCDNKGAIDLSKNPVQHSRTKHIEIRHHFLRDNVQKGNISIEKVSSEDNIADILTKPLKREPFNYLRLGGQNVHKKLNYCNTSNEVDVNLPTSMPKIQSPLQELSQEKPSTTHSKHNSLKSHLLPLGDSCDTNVGQALIPPQSANQTQLTQPSFPHLLINPHMASMLHAQTPPSPQGDNQIQPPLPPSPKMSIYDFMTLPSWSDTKIAEESHHLSLPLLERVPSHTTAPTTEGAIILLPTLDLIVASLPDSRLVKKSKGISHANRLSKKRKLQRRDLEAGSSVYTRAVSASTLRLGKRSGAPPSIAVVSASEPSHVGTSAPASTSGCSLSLGGV
ncbi:copia protein, partial [Tanacetum coccineum]